METCFCAWPALPSPIGSSVISGVWCGQILGATNEFGFCALQDRVHVKDQHTTIPRLLGLDHRKLTYLFEGRQQRLTDVAGDYAFVDQLIG